jgi:TetR/AcrR family transcriptional repressor of nem operon
MRVSREEKNRSHERIVEGAARIMRERGLDNTSVADVMTEAGLTHGGFYRHFGAKATLLESALERAFDEAIATLEGGPEDEFPGAVAAYFDRYLSRGHLENPGIGCPVAALGGDIARGDGSLKAAFGKGVNRFIAAVAKGMTGSSTEKRAKAARKLAMMAGAVTIARASDAETADFLLSACRDPARPARGNMRQAERRKPVDRKII